MIFGRLSIIPSTSVRTTSSAPLVNCGSEEMSDVRKVMTISPTDAAIFGKLAVIPVTNEVISSGATSAAVWISVIKISDTFGNNSANLSTISCAPDCILSLASLPPTRSSESPVMIEVMPGSSSLMMLFLTPLKVRVSVSRLS